MCLRILQGPGGAVGGVLHGDTGGREAVAHLVGGGEVTMGARLLALDEEVLDERRQRAARAVGRAGVLGPVRV
jgi:hypothetical protein